MVTVSSSSRVAFRFSRARYSRAILFFSTRTGPPMERPVTVVSLSLAFRTACL